MSRHYSVATFALSGPSNSKPNFRIPHRATEIGSPENFVSMVITVDLGGRTPYTPVSGPVLSLMRSTFTPTFSSRVSPRFMNGVCRS